MSEAVQNSEPLPECIGQTGLVFVADEVRDDVAAADPLAAMTADQRDCLWGALQNWQTDWPQPPFEAVDNSSFAEVEQHQP